MAEEKSMFKFFVYVLVIFVLLMIMIPLIFSFTGKVIRLELVGLAGLILLSLIGFVGYRTSWGERVLFFVFLFSLANLMLIWHFTNKLFLLPLFFSVFGFLMSLPRKEEEDFEVETYPQKEVVESLPVEPVVEEVIEKTPETPKTVKAVHSPGKYIASTGGSVYHEPKCDWAKRIVKKRMVWFNDKRSANRKGYRGHSCVK
tara:strand:+ start:409 stop:1011 length:603 start_codon:yes stop_codon:yes gene_type:complete